jgi:hypothetical protein
MVDILILEKLFRNCQEIFKLTENDDTQSNCKKKKKKKTIKAPNSLALHGLNFLIRTIKVL